MKKKKVCLNGDLIQGQDIKYLLLQNLPVVHTDPVANYEVNFLGHLLSKI